MASVASNGNGTLTITLTQDETRAIDLMPSLDTLQEYLTLWLAEQDRHVLRNRFMGLPAADQARVVSILKAEVPATPADLPGSPRA